MLPLVLSLWICSADPAVSHQTANPLYRDLIEQGLLIGPDLRTKLPAPTIPDGLTREKQTAAIKDLIAADYQYEEFTRQSVVAPQLLRIRDVMPSDPKAPARGVHVWFVAYGDFAATEDEESLDRLVNVGRGEGKAKALTKDDLAKRNIQLTPGAEDREGYGHLEFDFLERVRLQVTGRAMWSRTAESVVAAAIIDPRFVNDPDYPNQWRSISKETGELKVGPPHPWSGAGFYLKVTKLQEPVGALFIEQHIIYAEPHGWFDGTPILRSKLPPVVQNNVRNMRREWLKATGK
jgi:hypothetical protein